MKHGTFAALTNGRGHSVSCYTQSCNNQPNRLGAARTSCLV